MMNQTAVKLLQSGKKTLEGIQTGYVADYYLAHTALI